MGLITKIFTTGANELIKEVGTVVDDLITSKEEKLILKNKLKDMLLSHEVKMQQEVTKRWEADSMSDSWMSKNIRPYTLAYLIGAITIFTLIDFGFVELDIKEEWITLWQMLAMTAFGAYFGGRSWEKVVDKKQNQDK